MGSNRGKCRNAGQLHGQRTGNVYPVLYCHSEVLKKPASQRDKDNTQVSKHLYILSSSRTGVGRLVTCCHQAGNSVGHTLSACNDRIADLGSDMLFNVPAHTIIRGQVQGFLPSPTTSGWCGRWHQDGVGDGMWALWMPGRCSVTELPPCWPGRCSASRFINESSCDHSCTN